MTEQERDSLLLRLAADVRQIGIHIVEIKTRLSLIEREMVTQDGLERFMKATFGEMLSDTRIASGIESLHEQTPREPFVHRPTGPPSTRLPSPG